MGATSVQVTPPFPRHIQPRVQLVDPQTNTTPTHSLYLFHIQILYHVQSSIRKLQVYFYSTESTITKALVSRYSCGWFLTSLQFGFVINLVTNYLPTTLVWRLGHTFHPLPTESQWSYHADRSSREPCAR